MARVQTLVNFPPVAVIGQSFQGKDSTSYIKMAPSASPPLNTATYRHTASSVPTNSCWVVRTDTATTSPTDTPPATIHTNYLQHAVNVQACCEGVRRTLSGGEGVRRAVPRDPGPDHRGGALASGRPKQAKVFRGGLHIPTSRPGHHRG